MAPLSTVLILLARTHVSTASAASNATEWLNAAIITPLNCPTIRIFAICDFFFLPRLFRLAGLLALATQFSSPLSDMTDAAPKQSPLEVAQAAFAAGTNGERLFLSNMQLTDADATTIAGLLKSDTKTKRVFVGRNLFTDAGASAIAAAVGASSTIEELWLPFNKFGDAGAADVAAAFASSSSLKQVWVRGNDISAAAFAKIAAAGFADHAHGDAPLPEVVVEEVVAEDEGDLVW